MQVPAFLKYSFKILQNPCSTTAYLVVVSNLQELTYILTLFAGTVFERQNSEKLYRTHL